MERVLHWLTGAIPDDSSTPDQIGAEGTMAYLQDVGVSLEEPAMLAVLTQVKAPTMGELVKNDFINGWEELSADNLDKQRSHVARFRSSLRNNPDFFQRVYRHSFFLARSPSQKSVALDAAVEFWRMLFSPSNGLAWSSHGFDFLEHFITFVQDKWKKSIGKDLWDQTLLFARRTIDDPSLSWWNELESAWPSVLDDFANHIKSLPGHTRLKSLGSSAGEAMDMGE